MRGGVEPLEDGGVEPLGEDVVDDEPVPILLLGILL